VGILGRVLVFLVSCLLVAFNFLSPAGAQRGPSSPAAGAANPEMARLARALAGDWNTTEHMERSELFPNGGERRGTAHIHLAAGGTTLLNEVHSDGSAGKLDGIVVIWWDSGAKTYQFFTCFNGSTSPCEVRGNAHWEGNEFVNQYEESVHGKPTKWRDTWIHITPDSHTLVASMDTGNGTWRPLITTTASRR
jgi:Protein of unknown function (DUF1579)